MLNPLKVVTRIKLGDVRSSCCNKIPPEESEEHAPEQEPEKVKVKKKKNVNGK